jgi:lipoprotein-anchoring transpeptidase ErfK/SrfK
VYTIAHAAVIRKISGRNSRSRIPLGAGAAYHRVRMKRRTPRRFLPTVFLAVALGATACGGHRVVASSHRTTTTTTTMPSTTTSSTTTVPADPPGITVVADIANSVPGHSSPDGPVTVTVPATWYGYKSKLPVVATQPGWIEVRLAQRPNQSTAWIPSSAATFSTTPWHLVLSLASAHLMVYNDNRLVSDFPAGVGTPDDPTPTGHFFIAMTVPPPSPAYGAFVLATSAHSNSITDWENSGDAIIGIHGPIDSYDDYLIGTTGARISHGCIRLHDNELATLSPVLAGSPLDIVAN